jgi:hypothetical protein
VDRPGRERESARHRKRKQSKTAKLAQPPLQGGAELAGQSGHPVKAALDHQHCFASPAPFIPVGITS